MSICNSSDTDIFAVSDAIAVNIPLSETAAFRASVGHEYLSGFIDAIGLIEQTGTARNPGEIVLADPDDILGSGTVQGPPREDSNASDHTYARASFLFEPDEDWRFGRHTVRYVAAVAE